MVGYSKNLLALTCFVALSIMTPCSQAQNTPQDYLSAHNTARQAVGVGPIAWNDTVTAYAQKYANSRTGDCKMKHSCCPYGENLFSGYGKVYTAGDAVAAWVSKKQWYNYVSNSCASGKVCGHYTHVVWRNSDKLGCAHVKFNNGYIFIICNYFGQRPY